MTSSSIAVVAHHTRRAMADALAETVGAAVVFVDDGSLGASANHRRAWAWHTQHTTAGFALVVEDDAQPVDNFRAQLAAALEAAPAPIVSLYLGTGYPKQWQPLIARAVHTAGRANWLVTDHLIHAVAVGIRADLLPLTLDDRPTDEAITAWARPHGHRIAYAWPSLVDHADVAPVMITARRDGTDRHEPRRAWRTGSRSRWTSEAVPL